MSESQRVEFRLKLGNYEIEIKGDLKEVESLLSKSFDFLLKIKEITPELLVEEESEKETEAILSEESLPQIEISERESVTSILTKLFSTKWARKPRSLREIKEVLETLGFHYPKSTIAVSLARLVKRNVIRRIKKENVYVYVPVRPPAGE